MYVWQSSFGNAVVNIQINADWPEVEIEAVMQRVQRMLIEFDSILNRFNPESEVACLNGQRGKAIKVSESLFELLSFSMSLAQKSHGAFDPCVIDFLDAYGYRINRPHNPNLIRVLKNRRASFRNIVLDPETRSVKLLPSQRVDLSAITKGYVADLAAQILLPEFQNFWIDVGGDMIALGNSTTSERWMVPLHNPFEDVGGFAHIALSNMGLAITSSMDEDKTMILNPITGDPVHEAVSVIVIAPSAIRADGLATTAFVLGLHKGMALLEREPGVEGMFITPQRMVLCTTGMRKYFVGTSISNL